jgi:hypothetical protein
MNDVPYRFEKCPEPESLYWKSPDDYDRCDGCADCEGAHVHRCHRTGELFPCLLNIEIDPRGAVWQ